MSKNYRKITAIQDTWIKRSAAMASTLGDTEKIAYKRGESLEGIVLATEKNHTIVELKAPRFGFFNWHLFTAHWDLVPPAIKLNVPFYPQTDNYTQPDRTCNSSACAMFARYFGANITGDDDYLRRVLAIGDTTDHGVQTIVLNQLGIPSRWRTDLDFADLDRELEEQRPIVIGILHRGTETRPWGGHMIVVVGKDKDNYLCHDPYGNLYDGYTSSVENGRYVRYNKRTLERRWLVEGARSGWGRIYQKTGSKTPP